MLRPMYRSSSPFSLTDFDMWDTKSRFKAQSSGWCGMETVSGSGFLSKVNSSTSGSTSGFRQNDPGMRRWQSLSYLAPEGAPRSFRGTGLRAARVESSFRQPELVEWMQDAFERLDTQLDLLKSRDAQLNYNISTAQMLDMAHKKQTEVKGLKQERDAAELSQFEKSWQRRELHEKVQKLEKDLLQMKSTLNRGSHVQSVSPEKTSDTLSRALPMNIEDLNKQETQTDDTELSKLRAALRESEARAKTQEEERDNALQKLQTSTEAQKTLLNQIEEMMQSINHTVQNHSEVQDQLSEANNKISQACLEKAILSTQVLKLEENIKELKANLSAALSDKDHLTQEKANLQQMVNQQELQLEKIQQGSESRELHNHQANSHDSQRETVLMKEETKALREVIEKLTRELEMVKRRLEASQSQLQELTSEKVTNTKQIIDLEAERSQLISEKEELLIKMNDENKELTEMKEKCHQLGESLEALELEKQKLQDSCLIFEAGIHEKEEKLRQQEDKYRRQDAVRVQKIEELRAVTSNWSEKWQKVALTLQSTQEKLEEHQRNNSRNNIESDSLLRIELDACRQELELERSRSQALLQRCKHKGCEAVQSQDKDTVTDLNIPSQTESSLLWDPASISHSSQNKSSQQVKRASKDNQDEDTLKAQLEESRRKANQLEQEKMLAVQKLQTLRQLYPVKDENSSVDGRNNKTVCPVNEEVDQQRKMVTEQLKSLFKEREAKDTGKTALTGTGSHQDWTPPSNNIKSPVERRSWHQGSGLMPVFEEDEEDEEGYDWPGSEERGPEEEAQAETNIHSKSLQMSAMSAKISNLKAKKENLLQAMRVMQPIQDFAATAEKESDKSSDVGVPSHFSDEIDLQRRSPSLYPDGVFLAEPVDICSTDEEGEDED